MLLRDIPVACRTIRSLVEFMAEEVSTSNMPDSLVAPMEKGSPMAALPENISDVHLDYGHVLCLQALRALDDAELHGLAFLKATETIRLNRRKMHEDIFAVLAADKAKAFCVVKPLHRSLFHDDSCSFVN
jgi:hypothetical protein